MADGSETDEAPLAAAEGAITTALDAKDFDAALEAASTFRDMLRSGFAQQQTGEGPI